MATILDRYRPEERLVFTKKPRRMTDILCVECGEPLIEQGFVGGVVKLCDNPNCRLFRVPQATEVRTRSRTLAHYNNVERYLEFLKRTSGCYHRLRDLGFSPQFAKRFQSTKQTERITNMVKRGLSKESIYRMMNQ